MLQGMMKNVIKESTTQQLTEMYYELVQATSLRAAQGMGTDELLSETVAEVVAEMNARMGGSRGLCSCPRPLRDSRGGKESDE